MTALDIPNRLWLGGTLTTSSTGATFPVEDPATGETLAEVADASPADSARALDLADEAQAAWAAKPPRERGEILRTAFELVKKRADGFARTITLEMGKTLAEAHGEVNYGAEFLRWNAEEAVRIGGRTTTPPSGNGRILVTKEPVGPVLAVTPWNFPLAMATRKIGPALAAGCTIIVKPAAETPLTMLMLGQVFADAGLPEGVLSILPTSDAAALTESLITDPRLRKITFTGSTGVGKLLVRQSADRLLRTSMELGGNAPFLVFDDADIDAAVDGAMAAKMRNGGEACTAANRFYVAKEVSEDFTERLVARMSALRMGHGLDDGTDLGPLITAVQRGRVHELVVDAIAQGARLLVGGVVPGGPGTFYPPTVLDQVPADARVVREEIFGPVVAITTFDTEAEAITAANDTEYGLAAYFYTRDLDRAMRVASALKAGMVGVNRGVVSDVAAPFGGVKESGFGREGGTEGIEEYLETKYVAL
ncbi:NAD-dependent succinate-semialdehyde dehydrogenase [Rhodococcus coprophilus]|uniref:Gamma-hydrobutyrate dehydrogenase n=1 Tax=Rhodococcus coprophilus TaxID=38310 RepID=A0A2X4TR56_9NOCA|nr:NAD-dependent succinate-semialdehyde dehydrogenase [Rhodococcus coprophilus]MBM7457516.1 succinate-semialdehyde dehydrogenase/glutarate-semialdehyde dehydrogenase [Rhodococcus coprophilus]SQI29876.1 gamma-hydrobutyrate dehydrogenase [Rhodococcus coprophilus]